MSRICIGARLFQTGLRVLMAIDSDDRFIYRGRVDVCVGYKRRRDETDDDQ
jgi:hypothetical protein